MANREGNLQEIMEALQEVKDALVEVLDQYDDANMKDVTYNVILDAYGYMIGIVNGECKRIPLEESAGKLKFVDPNSSIISEAKMIGISFGD